MHSIIKFNDYCFNNCFFLTSGIYDYIMNQHNVNDRKYDFHDLLVYVKRWRSVSEYPNIQDLKDNCFGMISDGLRSIFLNKDEIDEQEILQYLPKSDFIFNHSYYSIVSGGSDNQKIQNLSVLLTGPGTYGTAFFISKGETKLTPGKLGYAPLEYIDKEKNLIWFFYADEYEDDAEHKLLKLSVDNFLAAMTIAKIYSAPNSFVTVFWWDEETQKMELSINNMFFKIDPAIVDINHPLVFWHECYKDRKVQSQKLNFNYYPEKN